MTATCKAANQGVPIGTDWPPRVKIGKIVQVGFCTAKTVSIVLRHGHLVCKKTGHPACLDLDTCSVCFGSWGVDLWVLTHTREQGKHTYYISLPSPGLCIDIHLGFYSFPVILGGPGFESCCYAYIICHCGFMFLFFSFCRFLECFLVFSLFFLLCSFLLLIFTCYTA